jgi:3'(2'), 5'-bisphosphate nucleotidase
MLRCMNDTALLSLAADLARRAGAAIMAIRARGFEVLEKADSSVVTAADHAAEEIIVRGLREALPGALVVAEEETAAGHVHAARDEYWLVDPLDGTREFAALRDEFTVNIGLIRQGRPVLGVVAAPALGELFTGSRGRGACKRTSAGEVRISARTPPAQGLAVMASRRSANDKRLLAYLGERRIASVVNIGSSLKFCRVAEGVADLYPRFGRTMEWDTAAAQAVLEAAGGHVRTVEGDVLGYSKPGWENPSFICSGADPV